MGSKTCMNILCGTTSSAEWKTGWSLRSGELANLCDKCGSAFQRQIFCEEYHADDSGWRECVTCGKRLHCGCIASLSLIELLDCGGVRCISCARNSGPSLTLNSGKCEGSGPCNMTENNAGLKQFGNYKEINGSNQLSMMQNPNSNLAFGLLKQEEVLLSPAQTGSTWISNFTQSPMGIFQKARPDISTNSMQAKDNYGAVAHPNLNITLGVPTGTLQATSSTIVDEREQRKMSDTFHQGFAPQNLLPTPPKVAFSPASDTNSSVIPQIRVARPPVEGRGRHQLLPRYWPRITDQELQQITGDSNCTIVPLFEKVLSASDAGRIGRLVLPKACAEAYFPPISQPEGLPIKIQDVKGKEWLFQFRFWPNNNSRMYVLEGVTPCIQSMQLQAGDTVTFSRMDPEGKLVMGFRKASNSASVQDAASPAIRNASLSSESFFSGVIENLPVMSGCSGLLQSMKGSTDTHINALPRQLDSAGGNVPWHSSCNERTEDGMLSTSMMMLERKKSRNIGSKSKRLLIDNQDVLALRLTWEEVQGMLRPPQCARPTIVVIEDYEIEEYEEPPVFGKSSIFTARASGVVEQWAQCDNCSKWWRLPGDILLPPKWTCADNAWDQSRCFCSAPEELGPRELENFRHLNKDSTKRRMVMGSRMAQEQESSGLNALATAAVLGDNTNDPGTSSVAATTKHPRHRPGCSCIVCIQPPSGKGKHKSTCTCTVCMTVKRRFKTLMMRKKKRQSEQEAEIALKNHQQQNPSKDMKADAEKNKPYPESQHETEDDLQVGPAQTNDGQGQNPISLLTESGKSLDLNFHPQRDEDLKMKPSQSSLTNLLQLASFPLEAYMKQSGLASLTAEQQASSTSFTGQAVGEIGGKVVDDHPLSPPEQVNLSNGKCEPENKQQCDHL
ncbi:B3 domain-containing transcription repressor VAL2-like [Chenopodium quinoa]|uniref:B3 domain-containing transcription repressor VAL2-like n=1 Tax=Chenopodium quinoa TaxID=63459 RepID=UPI000B77BFE1|nr:B3 domain-containing transcription repressor VAL2-like [Chenopodium quinoa]